MDHPSAGFERIAEALLEMQHQLQALEEENRQLHEALAALRRGMGITVVIEQRSYPLVTGVPAPDSRRPAF